MTDLLAPVFPLRIAAAIVRLDSSASGWTLLEPGVDGPRSYSTFVPFANPFTQPPVVHVAISGFDIENYDAARIRLRVGNVTAEGFEVVVETWLETRIWSVEVSWMAVGH